MNFSHVWRMNVTCNSLKLLSETRPEDYQGTQEDTIQSKKFFTYHWPLSLELFFPLSLPVGLSLLPLKNTMWEHSKQILCEMYAKFIHPVEALIFFWRLPSNCLNWKIYCDDHSSLS